MDALLVATGFTGALTLLWLARQIQRLLRGPAGAAAYFGEARIDAVVRAIGAARREVLLTATTLACRPIAQALIDARLRGAQVEVILGTEGEDDETSDLHFLTDQGLTPVAREKNAGPDYLLLDGRAVVLMAEGFALIAGGEGDLVQSFRDDFAARRPETRPSAEPAEEDLLTAVARGVTAPAEETASTPVVTSATAELFARLRKEAAEPEEEPPSKAA